MTTYSDDRGSREDRLSRLDQLEREIAAERDRLSRSDLGDDTADGRLREERQADERSAGPAQPDRRTDSVRSVDLPELEERVTESQREAWALGYQAGIADSQTRTGNPTQNPFHPLRGL
jgi:hypothetical protein